MPSMRNEIASNVCSNSVSNNDIDNISNGWNNIDGILDDDAKAEVLDDETVLDEFGIPLPGEKPTPKASKTSIGAKDEVINNLLKRVKALEDENERRNKNRTKIQSKLRLKNKMFIDSNNMDNQKDGIKHIKGLSSSEIEILEANGIQNYDINRLRGKKISEILGDQSIPLNRFLITKECITHSNDGDETTTHLYCKPCSRYYHCSSTTSTTTLCCPAHAFSVSVAELDSVMTCSKFLDALADHHQQHYHRTSEAKWLIHDKIDRDETYRQTLFIYNMTLKGASDVLYEMSEYSHAESDPNSNANKNLGVHRVEVVQKLLLQGIRLNFYTYIRSPSLRYLNKNFRFATLMSDTYGKGEYMCNIFCHCTYPQAFWTVLCCVLIIMCTYR